MKTRIQMTVLGILVAALVLLPGVRGVSAESLYEYYTGASKDALVKETGDMGEKLRTVFAQDSVKAYQQRIDFAEYFSSLKKAVLLSTKLATYSEYETDLVFARDKEIFKGLPEDTPDPRSNGPRFDRKGFVSSKYDRMKKDINEEIETYDDIIRLSLDTCETVTENDLTGILESPKHREKMAQFSESKPYQDYLAKENFLRKGWPALAGRISVQFSLWQASRPSPDKPIINPSIVGAI